MIIINSKFIFLKIVSISIKISLLILASIEISKDDKVPLGLFVLLFSSMSFFYLYIISSFCFLYVYLENINKVFLDNFAYEAWAGYFLSYKFKSTSTMMYSFINVIIFFYFISNPGTNYNTVTSCILIFILIHATARLLAFLLILCMHLRYQIAHPSIQPPQIELDILVDVNIDVPRQDTECPICLDIGEESWAGLKCGHKFHLECIEDWLRIKRNCPVCRENL